MVAKHPFKRFSVHLVSLDPAVGREIKKTRPCVIISPDEINDHLNTVIVAPMTTKGFAYPSRVAITFKQKDGLVVLDQLRSVDKVRLVKPLGKLTPHHQKTLTATLLEMFA